MRDAINNNPVVQAAVIGALLIGAAFFFVSSTGGGGEEEAESEDSTVTATATTPDGSVTVTAEASPGAATPEPVAVPPLPPSAAGAAPPLPRAVTEAFEANRTVVLLFVRNGGIDDRLVRASADRIRAILPRASVFVVPAKRIARYAAIAQGVAVERVPALVVVRPKELDRGTPVASVSYGFQSPQSMVQAVIDAGYKGPTVDYHP
jgi:hypothetical protein